MHKLHLSQARRIFLCLGAVLGLALLTGCNEVTITELTSSTLPANPSQIYTISARIAPKTSAVVTGSIHPRIIIDGQSYPMHPSVLGQNIYDFDYQLPAGRNKAAYYILASYRIQNNDLTIPREAYTAITTLNIADRYVLSLEVQRGPVGARVSVLGRGFTPQDTVYFNDTPARTVFESSNSLSFFVPAVTPDQNYRITVGASGTGLNVGAFHVDPSSVQVSPTALTLRTGEQQSLTFTIANAAPSGGMLLDVTTDIPQSVIMPEVIVPEGQTTVTVTVQGGQPGTGSLFLKGYGSGQVTIPVTVTK